MSAVVAAAAAKGVAGYSGQVASFIAKSARLFGSEFIAMQILADMLESLRYKLRMFGISIDGAKRRCRCGGGTRLSERAKDHANKAENGFS